MNMSYIHALQKDQTLTILLREHQMILILALITIAFALILKSIKLFMIQIGVLGIFYGIAVITAEQGYFLLFGGIEWALFVFVIFKYKKAVDHDYHLQLEKTHQRPRKLTRHDYSGSKRTFF